MDPSKPIIFYDIASGPPVTGYAPNPWKARYALNFKRVHYKTEWVELPQVASVRQKLECPPVRRHADGSAFYTLPMIQDPSTGKIVGDTFEIAEYLDEVYPDAPRLIPPSTTALHRAFNAYVDKIFTEGIVLLCVHGLPFNPETAETSKADFVRRAGVASWEDLTLRGADRTRRLEQFREALGGLATFYVDEDEPFLEGKMLKASLEEWREVRMWYNCRWERVVRALDRYAAVE
ncbi:hypothetical protein C8F01DRAFT_1369296 [Mycena amicta]|nr:hypothetical protein C8F01DRAFT_1369296 [Mycena amicta]